MPLTNEEWEKIYKEAQAKAQAKEDVYQQLAKKQIAEQAKNNNVIEAVAYGAKTGVNQMKSGFESAGLGAAHTVADVLGMDDKANVIEIALKNAAKEQAQRQAKINAQYDTNFGGLARGVSDVTSGAVNMVPAILAAVLTPQGKAVAAGKMAQWGAKALRALPSTTVMGANAAGSGINQALNEGAELDEAKKYGTATAVKEVATELPFAGIKYLPGLKNVGDTVASRVANETAKKIAGATVNMATEGAEESISEIIEPFIQRATYNENAQNASMEDIIYSFLVGGATAGTLNAGIKGTEKAIGVGQMQKNKAKPVQNAQNQQIFEQKMTDTAQSAQNRPEQAQDVPMTENPRNMENDAQNQFSQADFEQKTVENIQNQKSVENAPKKTLEMAERTFENVKDKNVLAYQQEHPEVKSYQQDVASRLLHDLMMGEKGRREVGIDPETRNVNTVHGIKRNQSEPINRMLDDGLSYKQIEDGLNRIVEDNGKENTTTAKRVELYVHDAMKNGFNSVTGEQVKGNAEYRYHNMSRDELQEIYDRLDNSFTGNAEADAAIISEMEVVQNLLNRMQNSNSDGYEMKPTVAENATTDEESSKVDSEAGERDRWQEMNDNYNSIPKGEDPFGNNRDIKTPKQTNDFDKVSTWVNTALEAEQVDDTTVGMIKDEITDDMQTGRFVYTPSGNQEQIERANSLINHTGWEEQAENFHRKYKSGQAMTADDIVLGERLIQEAQNAGEYGRAVDLIADVAAIGTELGRAVQALSVLKRLTPEGKLKSLQRIEQRINAGLAEQRKQPIALPKEIGEKMLKAKTVQEQSEVWDEGIQALADQVPATLADKINAWRYLAMLSNPKTHIRNLVGNSVMLGVSSIKRGIQTQLERRMLTDGQERRAELNRNIPQEYWDFAEVVFEEEKDRLKIGGGRYNDDIGQIKQNQRIFDNDKLETWRTKNFDWLEGMDMRFKKKTFTDSFARYMYANGLAPSELQSKASNASYEKAVQFAENEAKKVVFQEASKVANLLSQIENSNNVAKVVMGAMAPFKKTPINILKRGIEYSPVGLMNGIHKMRTDVETGKCTPAEAIDNIAAGLTGTGIMVLGYFMASMGMITAGPADDDERKQWYDQQMGSQNFALVLPNGGTATIDWLAPSVMPLMAGAELYNQLIAENPDNENSNAITSTMEAIAKVANPVLEMSMLQGITSALQSYNSGTTGVLSDLLTSTVTGYGGQFIPQPMSALARTIDDTVRSSYASKENGDLVQAGGKFLRQQTNKLPFASMMNEASIDLWGNERKREGDTIIGRAIHNFINPATYSSNKRTALDDKLDELYKATGESGVLPKSAPQYLNATEDYPKIYMSSEEYTQYAKTKGQNSQRYVAAFVNSSAYEQLPDDKKVEIISQLYDLANYQAKKELLTGRGYDYTNSTYEKPLKSGMDAQKYYVVKYNMDNIADKVTTGQKDKQIAYLNKLRNKGTITNEQFWYLRRAMIGKFSKAEMAACPYLWIKQL